MCCSGAEHTNTEPLPLQNSFQLDESLLLAVHTAAEKGQQAPPSCQYQAINVEIDVKCPQVSCVKRLIKWPAGSPPKEENAKKKGKSEAGPPTCEHPPTLFNNAKTGQQGDLEKTKARMARAVKSCVEHNPPKAPSLIAADEGIDAQAVAREWHQCVSLLQSYGIIGQSVHPNHFSGQAALPSCVAHPGFVGDGLQPKMCKACGTIEDAKNTVICDECQEAFHLSCCVPHITAKYFKREDNWFCMSCRKEKKKAPRSRFLQRRSTRQVSSSNDGARAESTARLGPAHQADVPEWKNGADAVELDRCVAGSFGMELPLSEEQKATEKDVLQKAFEDKVRSLGWLPADKLPIGTPENWLKCTNILIRAHKDANGHKHPVVVCGKWRRAPLHVQQADDWECFCSIEWDPLHADCAIPQELPTEEVMKRMSNGSQVKSDGQASHEVAFPF